MRRVDASLQDQVLEQAADRVVGERRHDRGAQPEAATQPARDVVLAATLGDRERARGRDATVARVEAKHHLAERNEVVAAVLGRLDREEAHAATATDASSTASRARRSISSKRRSLEELPLADPRASAGEDRRQLEVGREVLGVDAPRSGRSGRRDRRAPPPSGTRGPRRPRPGTPSALGIRARGRARSRTASRRPGRTGRRRRARPRPLRHSFPARRRSARQRPAPGRAAPARGPCPLRREGRRSRRRAESLRPQRRCGR